MAKQSDPTPRKAAEDKAVRNRSARGKTGRGGAAAKRSSGETEAAREAVRSKAGPAVREAAPRRRARKAPEGPSPDTPPRPETTPPEPVRRGGEGGGKPGHRARRRPAQTFLVAATVAAEDGTAGLRVYAAVTRTPAEALAAVRDHLGPDVPVGLTGKLSRRMAKDLRLRPGDVSRI